MAIQAEKKEEMVAKDTDNTAKGLPAKWEKTNDKVGLRPIRPILCPMCAQYGEKTEMVMRRSRLHRVADVRIYIKEKQITRPYAFDLAFKCPHCDHYIVFGVPTDIKYAHEVYKLRDNEIDFVIPEELWVGDPKVKEKLARWGYF